MAATRLAVMPRENKGESSLLHAQVEFVFDGGDLLAQGGEVVEDQDELPVGDVLGLPRADRLLGRLQQVVDGFRGDAAAAGAVQKLADFDVAWPPGWRAPGRTGG